MATTYSQIVRAVAVRINAITSPTASTLQSTYIITPFTGTEVGSSIFPYAAITDAVLNVEGRLADAIASTGDHPYRAFLMSTTGALTNGAALPSVDASSVQIIGQWGAVFDATLTTKIYRPKDVAQVIRRTANPNSKYKVTVYWYFMDDVIYHTGSSVKIKVCVYSRSAQATALASNGNILLPDSLADAYVAGAVSALVRDDEFMGQAQAYRQYYRETEDSIRGGLKSVPGKAETGPLLASPMSY